jgi:hypothetical protein
MSRDANGGDENRAPNHNASNGLDKDRFQPYPNGSDSADSTPTGNSSSKRTPSTTHPYQMSEAFANRHHHCERVDSLNRGIWTSFGPGGTAENPTGPATEMYLRCNHDGCSRIDWRTVHGLQCHIVKNHEQPKGTIGSLEKALERYGVPIQEVEDFEREHGRGSGGTMADPKNLKMKLKTKIQDIPGKTRTPSSYGVDPDIRPAGYRPSPTGTEDSPSTSNGVKKSPELASGQLKLARQDPYAPPAANAPSYSYTPVRSAWMGINGPSMQPGRDSESKPLQSDLGTPINSEQQSPSRDGLANGVSVVTPPSTVTVASRPETSQMPHRSPFAPVNHQLVYDTSAFSTKQPSPPPKAAEARPQEPKTNSNQTKPPAPTETKTKDEDIEMSGMPEAISEQPKENGITESPVKEKSPEPGKPIEPAPTVDDHHSETIEVDNSAGKETNGPTTRRSNISSPTMTTRSIAASTPGSVRRPSRRSSVARSSQPVEVENESVRVSEDGDKDDKDVKEEKGVKEEPRRSITGRVLRRGTKY